MSSIEALLTVARAYAKIEGVPFTTVSSRAFNDGKKLSAIAEGADINVGRLERTMQWFSDHWPDAPWPDAVPRPALSERAEARAS